MNKKIYLAIGFAVLFGCTPKQNQVKTTVTQGKAVTVATVKSERIVMNFRYSGSIEPYQTIPLTFQTSGRVEKVLVEEGDAVRKGQLLAVLEKNDPQNMYDITKAKYQQAKDAYDRLKMVHDQGSLPEIKWVEMETNLEQARLSMELAENNLKKCNLNSPANGIIGRRNIEPGMTSIGISAPLELVDISRVYVKISVPENEIGKIKKGIQANFVVSALDNGQFEGEVTHVSPVADQFSRTYEAKILVANRDYALKPGMVCDVKLDINSEKEAILIPYQCATKDEEGNVYVFVVDQQSKRVHKQIIQTGGYRGEYLEVLSGLTAQQVIVNAGKEKLSNNSIISL